MRHVWLCHTFPHYLINGTTIGKKLSKIKCVLVFSKTVVWNNSHSKKNSGRMRVSSDSVLTYDTESCRHFYRPSRAAIMSIPRSTHIRPAIEETLINSTVLHHHGIHVESDDMLTLAQSVWRLGDELDNLTEESWLGLRKGKKCFSYPLRPNGCEFHPTLYSVVTVYSFPGGKADRAYIWPLTSTWYRG
jgi:hypothetical protein